MVRTTFSLLCVIILLPAFVLAQNGKLRGKVMDRETGEPLVGANVLVEGTSWGAAADVNGEYVVLGIRPGLYTVRATYVGYAMTSVSNIRISAEITTTQDFALASSAVQVQAIEIVAERALIQRNTTNTVRLTTQEDIRNLPVRGTQNIVALQPGVVQAAGNLYVRGGRAGEVAYYVDGASVTNPLTNRENITVIQEAVEEIQLQAGGFTAEFGGSNSGIVKTEVRSGGANYRAMVEYETDDFAAPGKEFVGTTSQGYRNIVATLSGPLPVLDMVKLFAAYENRYRRNRNYLYLTPFEFNLVSDSYDPRGAGQPLPGPVGLKENYVPKNWQDVHTIQGTLQAEFQPIKLRFSGSYSSLTQPQDGDWPGVYIEGTNRSTGAMYNMFRQDRLRELAQSNGLASLRLTHVIDASTFYELTGSYQRLSAKTYDTDFQDDWAKYTDSIANAALGYTGWGSRWQGPDDYSVINAMQIANPNRPNVAYNMNDQTAWGVSLDATRQVNKHFELKAGGRFEQWTMRQFALGNIPALMTYLYGVNGNQPRTWSTPDERRVGMARAGQINNYGYDVDGNSVNTGPDAPFKPTFASGYVQTKFEYNDFILNFGLRYEYFKPNHKTFAEPTDPLTAFDVNLDIIDQSKLVNAPTYNLWLPRVSFSFPVTASTVFYAQYGKYAQMPSLNNLYVGNTTLSRTVSPSSRGNAYLTPVGFLMTPQRTTQYEIGFRQLLSENFAFTLSGWYKDNKDQLQVRNVVNTQGVALYRAYLNEDFGTVKGIELTLDLRRTNRLAARLNYTLSDALGTGSTPNSNFGVVEQGIGRSINMINPLSFNQRHRGTVLLDYRWAEGEGGPVLSGLGANLIFTFNSGHPYTKIRPPSSLGQATPWDIGTYPLSDPRYSYPTEPVNTSSTPSYLNIDLSVDKAFTAGPVTLDIYLIITNLLDTKNILNVYGSTGVANDDGWLTSPLASGFVSIPDYAAFYRAINIENRWSYLQLPDRTGTVLGGDIYGIPRQVRLGLKMEL